MSKKRFNLFTFILFFFFFNLFFGVNCLDERSAWRGTEESKNGIKTVKNTAIPVYGNVVLSLEEKISLEYGSDKQDIFGWVTSVELDSENNIYLLDVGKSRIVSFDSLGKYRFSFGGKGEGPGEFRRLKDFFIDKKGAIYVLDEHLIHIFDSTGNYKNRVKLDGPVSNFSPGGEGGIITSYLSYARNGKTKEIVVGYAGPGLGLTRELARYYEGEIVKVKSGDRQVTFHLNHRYTPGLYFTRTFTEKCIFGHSSRYALAMANGNGNILLKIEKEEKKVPVSKEEKDSLLAKFVEYYGKKWPEQVIKKGLQFPPHKPFFNKILVDDRDRIYVSKLPPVVKENEEERSNIFDLFDKSGYYIYRVSMPVRPHLLKSGYLYNIYVPSGDEDIKLRVFDITNWSVIKENYTK
ncbi:MAG: 6-bladed beta-propeller [Candidatus Aminicenantes bacterium]|nr:6-bladed beta-propeller [Candidatus Aminicenantes bacterium]